LDNPRRRGEITCLNLHNSSTKSRLWVLLNSDIESHAVPAAGRQRREGAKTEREKGHVVAEVLKRFHQFGEFFFAEISQNDFAALRLCARLYRVLGFSFS
jgi:hypothetical protein